MEVNGRVTFGDSKDLDFNYTNQASKEELKDLDYQTKIALSRSLIKGSISNMIYKIIKSKSHSINIDIISEAENITDTLYALLIDVKRGKYIPQNILVSVISNELLSVVNQLNAEIDDTFEQFKVDNCLEEIYTLAQNVSQLSREA